MKQRLIFALLAPLVLILVFSSIFDFRLAKQTAAAAHDQALADTVFDLESHIQKQKSPVFMDLAEETESMLRSNAPDMLFFAVRDASGKTLFGDGDLPLFAPATGSEVKFVDGLYRGKPVRIALHHLSLNAAEIDIEVMETTEKRKHSSQRILAAMVVPNLAVIFATLLAVLFGVRHGLLPLRAVEREIAARSVSDLREIELAGTPAEIRPMLRRLNELFTLLRESAEVQQRFIADAAHQLRTPLAGLQTQLDLAAGEGAFAHNAERLAHIEEATTRIGHLLSQLLTYARAETANPVDRTFATVALDQLVEKSASTFLDAALAKNIDLGFEIAPASVTGLSWMLQEALGNLIDNAIRYTPNGGVITVRCGEGDGQAFIEVEDSGPGVPREHHKHVFERFYRIPGAPGNGCGLGLAIVSEIAQLHGASVLLDDAEAGGLQARIQFRQAAG
ncbi:MAG TPA: sensor histidine kinase N-terminal domain-containing protein [Azonexus sp.]|nr:sensor histidine kinase N-terminal domain-containing protein [Azonexus sp.]